MRTIIGVALIVMASGVMVRGQSLQEQGACALQAQRTFREDWQNPNETLPANLTAVSQNYQSHFNTKLKKCLVLIETPIPTNQRNSKSYSRRSIRSRSERIE